VLQDGTTAGAGAAATVGAVGAGATATVGAVGAGPGQWAAGARPVARWRGGELGGR
jgi:hypothetical protein